MRRRCLGTGLTLAAAVLVDAPTDARHSTEVGLVAHGIGQRLCRGGAVDLVAVGVDQSMEVREGQGSVVSEDVDRGRAQRPADDLARVCGDWA